MYVPVPLGIFHLLEAGRPRRICVGDSLRCYQLSRGGILPASIRVRVGGR